MAVPSPAQREIWFLEAAQPVLVLGSAQPEATVDRDACARLGVDVVRRRSGGGAVLLRPGEALWIDVIVPAGDARWDDDVGRASHWLGDVWAAALGACGVPDTAVHRGGLVRTPWSDRVCFAGRGPGEVTAAGRKVVGISQRRTREAARFQCVALATWDPAALTALLRPPAAVSVSGEPVGGDPAGGPVGLDEVAAGVGVPLDALAPAFLAHLPA